MPKATFFNLPEEKRELILDIAIDEFAARGFEGASISAMVARAGIAKGSFYQYFDDKADLFMYLVKLVTERKSAYFADRRPPDPTLDLFAYLRWAFELGVEFAALESRLNQAVSRVMFAEGLYQGATFQSMREQSSRMFAALIQSAIDRGEIDPAIDTATAAFILETLLNTLGLFIFNQQALDPAALELGSLEWLNSERARQIFDSTMRVLEQGFRRRE